MKSYVNKVNVFVKNKSKWQDFLPLYMSYCNCSAQEPNIQPTLYDVVSLNTVDFKIVTSKCPPKPKLVFAICFIRDGGSIYMKKKKNLDTECLNVTSKIMTQNKFATINQGAMMA